MRYWRNHFFETENHFVNILIFGHLCMDTDSISLEIESDSDDDEELRIKRSRQASAKHPHKRSSLARPFEKMKPVNCNEIKLFRFQSTNRQSQGDPSRRKSFEPRGVARSYTKYNDKQP